MFFRPCHFGFLVTIRKFCFCFYLVTYIIFFLNTKYELITDLAMRKRNTKALDSTVSDRDFTVILPYVRVHFGLRVMVVLAL